MGRDRWHLIDEEGCLTLTRRLPVRFDLAVEGWLPEASRTCVAHRLRQDMWRELQDLRGFAPAVQVWRVPGGLHVRAGGSVAVRFPRAAAKARIAALLQDPARVARWTQGAR